MQSKNNEIIIPIKKVLNHEDPIDNEILNLNKKYQEDPDTFLKDYDEMIKQSIVGIIANFNTTTLLRADLIDSTDILIRIREFVVDCNGNNSSCNNKK